MPRPKKKLLDGPQMLSTGTGQEFWQNRLDQIQRFRGRAEPPTVVRTVLDEPIAPPRQEMIPEVPRLRTRPPEFRGPSWVDPNRAPVNEPAPVAQPPSLPRAPVNEPAPVAQPPSLPRAPVNEPAPVAQPPSLPRASEPIPIARVPRGIPRAPVEAPAPFRPSIPRPPVVPNRGVEFEPNLNYPEWTEPIQEAAFNAGRSASTAGRALTTAAEAAGVAAGETLTGIGGAIGLEGGAAMLAGGGILGAGALVAGLLGYGVYILGKRLHDKFKAIHEHDGQAAALAALARQVRSNSSLNAKFEKVLAPEDMHVLNDHIELHKEIDLGTAKRKKPEQVEQKDEQQELPPKQEKRVFADDSDSTIHNTHKESTQITPAPKMNTPVSQSSSSNNDIQADDKQMFQPPEVEKPIDTTEHDRQIYNSDRPQQQQPKQSFQDNSINSIKSLNNQQQPRLSI